MIKSLKPPPGLNTIQGVCWKQFGWTGDDFLQALCLNDVWTAGDAGFMCSSIRGKTGWIDAIYVSAKYRGKGIASKLFKKVETVYKVRGVTKTVLYVRSDNPAQTLYFKLGYRVVDIVRNYYGKGIHAVEMSKKLRRKNV